MLTKPDVQVVPSGENMTSVRPPKKEALTLRDYIVKTFGSEKKVFHDEKKCALCRLSGVQT